MKKGAAYYYQFSNFSLITLWVYSSVSKVIDFGRFEHDMHSQEIFAPLAKLLIYFLPTVEFLTAGFLLFNKTRQLGLRLSTFLLLVFTIYIISVVMHVFKRIPCPCGGFLQNVSWETHLLFNLYFLITSIISLIIFKEGRRGKLKF